MDEEWKHTLVLITWLSKLLGSHPVPFLIRISIISPLPVMRGDNLSSFYITLVAFASPRRHAYYPFQEREIMTVTMGLAFLRHERT